MVEQAPPELICAILSGDNWAMLKAEGETRKLGFVDEESEFVGASGLDCFGRELNIW